MGTIRKYLVGWLSSSTMQNVSWFNHWFNSVSELESEDFEIVVFKIPKKQNGFTSSETTEEIELLLQDKYKE